MAEEEQVLCLGTRCFPRPYEDYSLPRFYKTPPLGTAKLPGRDFRWKSVLHARASFLGGGGLLLRPIARIERAYSLPELFGIGNDARWRWQGPPVALLAGCQLSAGFPLQANPIHADVAHLSLQPITRLKLLAPLLPLLEVEAEATLLPFPSLSFKRTWVAGAHRIVLRAEWTGTMGGAVRGKERKGGLSLRVEWGRGNEARLGTSPSPGTGLETGLGYTRSRHLTPCRKLGFRDPPRKTATYLRGAQAIGWRRVISVVPGHWVDSGSEPGAAGERDFNMEVANRVEGELGGQGWIVRRPDREAPNLRWETYLNWVSKQSLQGFPVMEIHGQGSFADYRGFVQGVIGDQAAPLNQELAQQFGVFPLDWRELAVPRRGGVIIESFNSDEVLQMAPWHRTWAVGQISKQITGAIERASEANRKLRGFGIDVSGEGDRQSVASWEDGGMDGTESSRESGLIRMFGTGLRHPKQWQAFWDERRKKFK